MYLKWKSTFDSGNKDAHDMTIVMSAEKKADDCDLPGMKGLYTADEMGDIIYERDVPNVRQC